MFVRCFSYVEKLQGRAGAGKKEVKTACCQEWAVSSAQERHSGTITHCSPFPGVSCLQNPRGANEQSQKQTEATAMCMQVPLGSCC